MVLARSRTRLLAGAAVLALAAGCSSAASEAPGADATDYDGPPVEITYASVLFGNPKAGPILEAMLDDFNSSQDSITVTPAAIPFPTFAQTVLTQMGGGQGPDIIRFDTPEFYQAARSDLLLSLDNVIDAEKQNISPTLDTFTYVDDTRYGVISNSGSYALLYNTDLVETPPTNYDEFFAAVNEQTTNDTFGLAFRTTLPEESGMWQDLWNYVYGFGGSWSDGENLTLDSPEVLEGLEAFKDLYDAGVIPQGATASTYRTMFAEGKVAFLIDNGGTADNLLALNPDLHYAAVEIPFPVDATGGVLGINAVNAASENPEATLTFLAWMLTPEAQDQLLQATGSGSALATPVQPSEEDIEASPILRAYIDANETMAPQVVRGFEEDTPIIRQIVIEQVVAALHGDRTLEEAMAEAQQRASEAVGG